MKQARRIHDFVQGSLSDLRPGEPLTFDVYLYFERNRHVMLWRRKGEVPPIRFLARSVERGISRIWIHKDDEQEFRTYLNPPVPEQLPDRSDAVPAPEPEARAEEAVPQAESKTDAEPDGESVTLRFRPRTEPGAYLAAALSAQSIGEDQKKSIVSEAAQELFRETASAETLEEQKVQLKRARQTVEDVLDSSTLRAEAAVSEIWKLANIDADLEHAVNVATYAVIFAMAFGRIDTALLADIAMAGLLHDVGISQIPAGVTSIPWKSMDQKTALLYAEHVDHGLRLLQTFAPSLPQRVRTIISQHHEKFNGSGYPRGLRGFGVDDVAQLLALADLLDAVSSGAWDGVERTLRNTFETLDRVEKSRTFPEHFNPDVYAIVMRWLRSSLPGEESGAIDLAVRVVSKGARGVAGG